MERKYITGWLVLVVLVGNGAQLASVAQTMIKYSESGHGNGCATV